MTITTEVNEAKDDLDTAMGELRRVHVLLEEHLNVGDILGTEYCVFLDSLNIIEHKVRRVRASL
ncbi:hypothetical protein KIV66_gp76 [Mycobacterium phage MyraDee]|uniref:Uncharacterized protein n=1 Tax=Mycobacterium phage MyraDee TaxID=2024303 RepID=A0A222YZ34_9CAUD|nr:hypothetical protein KIV66_gp76 [Mycobacterium phage MyraDee]ASR77183.1 hypothetical protein SEA_MYRADEE_76 [Mycobacterium phage MyraDee]